MNITICDICKEKLERGGRGLIRVINWGIFKEGEYCEKCWADRKNWPKIHQKKK